MGWRIEMRIAVCDDDKNFCKEMLKYLQGYFKEKKLRQNVFAFPVEKQ